MMKQICTSIALLVLFCCTNSFAAEVVLITNKSNSVSSLSRGDAKNIFLGKSTKWSDGSKVTPFIQKDTDITDSFAKTFVSKSGQQFDLFWRKALFTGKGTPPVEVVDSVQMKKIVAAKDGSLGYILTSEMDDTVKELEVQ